MMKEHQAAINKMIAAFIETLPADERKLYERVKWEADLNYSVPPSRKSYVVKVELVLKAVDMAEK